MRYLNAIFIGALIALVTACGRPGPHFRGLPATRVSVDGATFEIRVQPRLAEAIRVNTQYAPRMGPIGLQAARAMHMVSGCHVTEVRGDAAVITGLLDCGDGPPRRVLVPGFNYECTDTGPTQRVGPVFYSDFDCEPVLY